MSFFSRIKTSTFLICCIALFGLLQLVSGGLFLNSLSNDKENFFTASAANDKVTALTNAWYALNATRSDANRIVIWIQQEGPASAKVPGMIQHGRQQLQEAEQWYQEYQSGAPLKGLDPALTTQLNASYKAYSTLLQQLMDTAETHSLDAMFAINAAPKQQAMLDDYEHWRSAVNHLTSQAADDSNQHFTQMMGLLAGIMLLVLACVALSWRVLQRVLLQPLAAALSHIDAIEHGDLTQPVKADPLARTEMGRLHNGLARMQQALVNTVSNVRNGSGTILTGVSEIAAGNADLSSRTEQQAASLEQTAASMEQITATVRQNADNALQASKLAVSASDTAEKGGDIVDGVIKTIYDLEESAKKIAEITGVIESIAFQTNILALNAAVEAARAGENGRGFAVVAGEVRNLAQRSAAAAKDIKGLIEESSLRVEKGTRLAVAAEESMEAIVVGVKQVRDIMDEISSASEEQSRGISQVGIAVAELDRVTQQNASLVEESSSAASQLEDQARHLNQTVATFRLAAGVTLSQPVARKPAINAARATSVRTTENLSTEGWEAF
ncbi:methyl-accepting chemotaxis protein II [Mixta theicola]|uniref:Methyl-accepting chemotaxis protein II n=1 Tax=Mixta theicola TaxID=1458355 RepID=A0A2K1QDZ9_9GAMM|nr:methyl-accepting chemotaxis protein [Mixta theicola]PNS13242.1 methyl-accepting chemotaxis protein II [Mixta theicola]GLR09330.1 methyl-accepting chemotaxis protein [Mixta theicola]